MLTSLFVFLGAGLGGLMRFMVTRVAFAIWGPGFPWGTLIANVSGSFVMGILSILILERYNHLTEVLRPLILIGFLGGYTTFSSFSIETMNLLEAGHYLQSFLNILLSVMLCLIAAWIGILMGKNF